MLSLFKFLITGAVFAKFFFSLAFLQSTGLAEARTSAEYFDPVAILLTWQRDPTTTMTIDWHTVAITDPARPASIVYKREGSGDEWQEVPGHMFAFPFTDRTVNRVELTGLEPNSTYLFRIGPPASARFDFTPSKIYRFRTMPSRLEDRPLMIGIGGDNGYSEPFRRVSQVAMQHDLDFIVIGGDLSYADGGAREWGSNARPGATERMWRGWFDIVKETKITEDGRIVPMILGIGNHEVWKGHYLHHSGYQQTDAWRERLAPVYYNVFAFPGQPGFGVLDFGDYLSFILLDSAHTNPIEGIQTEWLENVLQERAHVPHRFPVYHVAAYPTVRAFDGRVQSEIREIWHPIFDAHGIEYVFENHDHTYKRTHPIRGGSIHPEGVIYVGDGAWGMGGRGDRMHDVDETWYLDKALPDFHCIILRLDTDGAQFRVFNDGGDLIDSFPRN